MKIRGSRGKERANALENKNSKSLDTFETSVDTHIKVPMDQSFPTPICMREGC
jgi:hypothetical protein